MDYIDYIDSDGGILKLLTKNPSQTNYNPTSIYYNSKKKYHRLDGPAIIYKDYFCSWFKNNKRHRIGGPAICNRSFDEFSWWINNKEVKVYYIYG